MTHVDKAEAWDAVAEKNAELTRLRSERDKALADCRAAINTRKRHELVIDELREENERLRSDLEKAQSEQKRWEHLAEKCWAERDDEFNRRLPETLAQIEREAAFRSDLKKAIEALKEARNSLNWCAREGRMAAPSLHEYPKKWAANVDAILSELENSK